MILVEDFGCALNVDRRAGRNAPGQRGHPLEIRAGDAVFGRGGGKARQSVELAQGFGLDLRCHAGGFQLGAQLFDLSRAVFAFAELLLDGLELLAEIELALALRELALHLGLDAASQLHQLEFARELEQNLIEPHQAVGLLEQFLPFQMHQGGQVTGHEIGQPGRFDDLRGRGGEVVGQVGRAGNNLLKEADHVLPQRFHFGRDGGVDLHQLFDPRPQERLGGRELAYADSRGALAEQEQVVARHADGLVHHAKRADFIQVLRLRRIHARVELGDDCQGAVFAHTLHQRYRTGAADGDGQHCAGIEDDIAHRQNRNVFEQCLSRVGHSPSVTRGGSCLPDQAPLG